MEFADANSVAAAAAPSGADSLYPVLVVPSLYIEPEAPVHAHQLAVVLLARVCEVPATFPRTLVVLSSESITHKVCVPVLVTLDELQAPRVLNGVCAATGTAAVPSWCNWKNSSTRVLADAVKSALRTEIKVVFEPVVANDSAD